MIIINLEGDGREGYAADAPYDAIYVGASAEGFNISYIFILYSF